MLPIIFETISTDHLAKSQGAEIHPGLCDKRKTIFSFANLSRFSLKYIIENSSIEYFPVVVLGSPSLWQQK